MAITSAPKIGDMLKPYCLAAYSRKKTKNPQRPLNKYCTSSHHFRVCSCCMAYRISLPVAVMLSVFVVVEMDGMQEIHVEQYIWR